VPSDMATMNLSLVDKVADVAVDEEKGTILHEFGHALGLEHEMNSPMRAGTVTLNERGL
jgi:hypothetical protein